MPDRVTGVTELPIDECGYPKTPIQGRRSMSRRSSCPRVSLARDDDVAAIKALIDRTLVGCGEPNSSRSSPPGANASELRQVAPVRARATIDGVMAAA